MFISTITFCNIGANLGQKPQRPYILHNSAQQAAIKPIQPPRPTTARHRAALGTRSLARAHPLSFAPPWCPGRRVIVFVHQSSAALSGSNFLI